MIGRLACRVVFAMGLVAVSVRAEELAPCEPGPASPLWCRHTILVYASPARGADGAVSKDDLKWLVAYCDPSGEPKDLLFDGFLILGFSCKDGRHLLPLADRGPAVKADWLDAMESYLATAQSLSDAFDNVATKLNRPDVQGKVILAMPYPDTRQRSFELTKDRRLDLAHEADRAEAMEWYVSEAARRWNDRAKRGALARVKLAGFYWGHESIGDSDAEVVKRTSSHVHRLGCLMHWIPSFGGARKDWRELGLDCVTQQINYQNPQKPGRPLTIFDGMTRLVAECGLNGVEMTPGARETNLNPRIWSWRQVHLANLEAALRLGWGKYPAMTYFEGNSIPTYAADPKTHVYYRLLYQWVKGDLTPQDVEHLSDAVLDDLKSKGLLTEREYAETAQATSVLERLRRLEGPKLKSLDKAEQSRLAAFTRSSPNLLRDGSFEQGTADWPKRSPGVTRSEGNAHQGKWSLQLVSQSDGRDIVRAYAKSARIPLRPGQAVRFSAWVQVPQDLRDTFRGLLVGVSRYRQGKCLATWSDCETSQIEATGQWNRLTVNLVVDDKPCDEVELIIGLCGTGQARVDDAELVTLERP